MVFFMRGNNPNSTANLIRKLDEDWDEEAYHELMRIEDILENRKRLKIIKKYWRAIFRKAKREFDWFMHWCIGEVNAIPPKRVPKSKRNGWRNDFVPQESENVKWLILIYDTRYDSWSDCSNGTIYVKTKKWYFSIYFND